MTFFWLSAVSKEMIEQGLSNIAEQLGILQQNQSTRAQVKRYLASTRAMKCLIIIDNADDLANIKETELDQLPHPGVVIWTTRRRDVAQAVAQSDTIEIGNFRESEAQNLLAGSLVSLTKETGVNELLRELEYLPLAIQQAAAFMNVNQIPPSKYLQLLKNERAHSRILEVDSSTIHANTSGSQSTKFFLKRAARKLFTASRQDTMTPASIDAEVQDELSRHNGALASTWTISFQEISAKLDALKILQFISCIEPKAIPQSILPGLGSEIQLVKAVGVLSLFSFVTKDEDDRLHMHRLVHLAARRWFTRNSNMDVLRREAVEQLHSTLAECTWVNLESWREALPHAVNVEEASQDVFEARRWLCWQIAACMSHDGRPHDQLKWSIKGEALTRKLWPRSKRRCLVAQQFLAKAYQAAGMTVEAVDMLQSVVTRQAERLGNEHVYVFLNMQELASACIDDGQTDRAIRILQHVVTEQDRLLVADHAYQLSAKVELATAYLKIKNTGRAMQLLEYVVIAYKRLLADQDPARLHAEHSLAEVYIDVGRAKDSLILIERVVRVRVAQLSANHPVLLASQFQLARAYHCIGHGESAIQLLEHFRASYDFEVDKDNRDRMEFQFELGRAYLVANRPFEAAESLELAIALHLDDDTARQLKYYLAVAYLRSGRPTQAVTILEQVLESTVAKVTPLRLRTQFQMALARSELGQVPEAVELLEGSIRSLSEASTTRSTFERRLGITYLMAGDTAQKALPLLEHVLSRSRAAVGVENPQTLKSMECLAAAYARHGRLEQGRELMTTSYQTRARLLEPESSDSTVGLARVRSWLEDIERCIDEGFASISEMEQAHHTKSFKHEWEISATAECELPDTSLRRRGLML